jgi:H+-translocating NAD(P) transhydrogenase subunit alpha
MGKPQCRAAKGHHGVLSLQESWRAHPTGGPSGGTVSEKQMTDQLLMSLYIFALAGFVGHYVIESVPPLLHTPLMAGTNAISGIALVGSIVVAGSEHGTLATTLGTIAVMCASINTVGGFLITDRMLKMFKSKEKPGKAGAKKS